MIKTAILSANLESMPNQSLNFSQNLVIVPLVPIINLITEI